MRVICIRRQLSKALSVVGRALRCHTSSLMTSYVLLGVEDHQIRLTAANKELAVVARVDADVSGGGAIAVPGRLLAQLVRSLSDDRITLDVACQRQTLVVSGSRSVASVKGLDAGEFPPIDQIAEPLLFTVPGADLRRVISAVQFAAAQDESRPQLSGLLVRAQGAELTIVGCDSFRLAVYRLKLPAPVTDDIDLIVPVRTKADVARLQGASADAVRIAVATNRAQVLFHTSDVDIVSRIIVGSYVNFHRVLDQAAQHNVKATVATAEFGRAASFTSLVSKDANHTLRLQIAPPNGAGGSGRVTLQATAAQLGEDAAEVDAAVEGTGGQLAVGNIYVSDALNSIGTQQVTLSGTVGKLPPLLLKPVGNEDVVRAVMPLHLQD